MRLSDVGREVSTFDSGVADICHVFAVRTVEVLGNHSTFREKGDGNNSHRGSIVKNYNPCSQGRRIRTEQISQVFAPKSLTVLEGRSLFLSQRL